MRRPTPWLLPLAIFVLALLPRAVYWGQLRESPFFRVPLIDAKGYHDQATAVAKGQPMEDGVFWQPPFYPWALGQLYRVTGPDVALARAVQLFVGALLVALTAVLGRRLFGERAGWATGVLLAFYGPLVFFEAELLSPIAILALSLAAFFWLIPASPGGTAEGTLRSLSELRTRRLAWAGFFLGVAATARSEIVIFAGVVAIAVWVTTPRGARLPRVALFSLALAAPLLPVVVHNRVLGGEWVPMSSNVGIALYVGNSGDYEATVGVRPGSGWDRLIQRSAIAGVPNEREGATSRWWVAETGRAIRRDPATFVATLGRKLWLAVGAAEVNRLVDPRFTVRFTPLLGDLPGWWLLFPLAAVGLVLALRDGQGSLLAAFLACSLLALVVFFVAGRYRLPTVGVLAIFAGLAIRELVASVEARQRGRAVGLVLAVVASGLLIQLDPFDAAVVDEADGEYLLGNALDVLGRHDEAAAAYSRAIAYGNPHWDSVFNLAGLLVRMGDPAAAVPLYQRLLEHDPDDLESLGNAVDLLLRAGQSGEAVALMRRHADRPEALPHLLVGVGRRLCGLGRFAEAQALLDRAIASGYAASEVHLLQSELLARRSVRMRLLASLEAQDPVADPSPDATPSSDCAEPLAAARAEMSSRRLDAELGLARVLAEPPSRCGAEIRGAAWYEVGRLWFLSGEAEPATAAFRRAIAIDPEASEPYYGLAFALASHATAAVAEVESALEAYLVRAPPGPHADTARRMLTELRSRPPVAPPSGVS